MNMANSHSTTAPGKVPESADIDSENRANQRLKRLWSIAHRPALLELGQKVEPAHAALLVIDVQNDFCAEGGMMHAEGLDLSMVQGMAERLGSLIDAARGAGVLCIFVKNVYSTTANWYLSDSWLEQAWRRRGTSYIERDICGENSWSGEFYGDIRPKPDDPIVIKHRYDAFTNTDLDLILRAHNVRTVVLSGVATNVCVETTARTAFVRDYYVVIPSDAVATYSLEEQRNSLGTLDRYFAEVVTIEELQSVWEADVQNW
jgi:ureidoacrylate peracid hydrolase